MVSKNAAAEILAIYEPYIRHTAVTFEIETPSLDEFAARVAAVGRLYPYLAAEFDGKIVGYAYAHQEKARAAYGWNAELSVYAAEKFAGRGVGRTLYGALLRILRLQNVYAAVAAPNERSERLHGDFGFRPIGVLRKAGFKNGAWRNVLWFEKHLGGLFGSARAVSSDLRYRRAPNTGNIKARRRRAPERRQTTILSSQLKNYFQDKVRGAKINETKSGRSAPICLQSEALDRAASIKT